LKPPSWILGVLFLKKKRKRNDEKNRGKERRNKKGRNWQQMNERGKGRKGIRRRGPSRLKFLATPLQAGTQLMCPKR